MSGTGKIGPSHAGELLLPNCGTEVEIWTDEKKRKCPQCGETIKKEEAKKA
jgi:predicted RNA-binding Zn-ribbon protein involved in translation (DUF1610 family)